METIKLPHGYTARIELDDTPANPWADGWCEPPVTAFNERRLDFYGTEAIEASDIFDMIPDAQFQTRAGRREVLRALEATAKDYADALRNTYPAPLADRSRDALRELLPEPPRGWGEAESYFSTMEALATVAGVACYSRRSNGYSQGDSARVFVALTDKWRKESGCTPDPEQDPARAKAAFDLWSAWAWGDVYGVSEILRPDGEEIPMGSCWGFYGSDHDASGLMDHCASTVKSDLQHLARESAAAHDAACRDIATV